MNPEKPKIKKRRSAARKGIKTMAKKRKARKRRNPANPRRRRRVRARRNPANPRIVYRYRRNARKRRRVRRNPSQIAARAKLYGAGIKPLVMQSIAILTGFIGSRALTNMVIPAMSGYIRGGAQIALGLIGVDMVKNILPAKIRGLAPAIAAGCASAGVLTIIDTVTANKYRSWYNLAGAGNQTYYIPGGMGRYLPMPATGFNGYEMIGEDGFSSTVPASASGSAFKSAF